MVITKTVRLDLTPGAIPPRVKVSQYDDLSREIVFTLDSAGSVSDVQHAYVCGTKPDGHGFQYDATINQNGTITVVVVLQMTACSGEVPCELKLTKTESNKEIVLNSANFILDVEKAALGEDTIISDTEIPAIIDAAETNAERAEQAAARAVDAATHGPYIGANGHWYVWNNSEGIYVDTQVVAEGEDGVGISSIAKTGTSGLVDTYTITFTNGQTTTFTVTNGEDGTDGVDGVSITNIDKTGTAGRIDTYTIYFSNGRTEYFTVTNGTDALPTGGTAGQVLKKSSSTLYDASWGDMDIPVATSQAAGKVKPDGTTITVDSNGTISSVDQTPIATTSTAGKVKPDGTTITINSSGTITAQGTDVPIATTSTAGKVKPDGSTITVTSDGTITAQGADVPIATTSTAGKVKPDGTTITVDANGKIASVDQTPIATTSTAGKVKPDGTTITVNSSGTISSVDQTPIATTSTAGKVKPDGSTITVNSSGTISSVDQTPIATTSTAGKVKPDGSTITIDSNGTISATGTTTVRPMSKTRYTISSSSWSSSQTSGYYTYNLTLSPILYTSYAPNIYLAGSSSTTEPTDTGKAMYSLVDKCDLSAQNKLVLYAKTKPTSTFYIYVEGQAL